MAEKVYLKNSQEIREAVMVQVWTENLKRALKKYWPGKSLDRLVEDSGNALWYEERDPDSKWKQQFAFQSPYKVGRYYRKVNAVKRFLDRDDLKFHSGLSTICQTLKQPKQEVFPSYAEKKKEGEPSGWLETAYKYGWLEWDELFGEWYLSAKGLKQRKINRTYERVERAKTARARTVAAGEAKRIAMKPKPKPNPFETGQGIATVTDVGDDFLDDVDDSEEKI